MTRAVLIRLTVRVLVCWFRNHCREGPWKFDFQNRALGLCSFRIFYLVENTQRHYGCYRRWDSVVGIATYYGLDGQGVGVPSSGGVKYFLFSTASRPDLGSTQPPSQRLTGALSPGVKRPGRDADHLPPVSAEVKKIWIYTSTPPYVFMA
jgi:hypothetical protein